MALTSKLRACDVHEVTTIKHHVLGTIAYTADGRKYRYAKSGTTALSAGDKIVKNPANELSSTVSSDLVVGDSMVTTALSNVQNGHLFEDSIATIGEARYLAGGVSKNGVVSLTDKIDTPTKKGAAVKVKINQFCAVSQGVANPVGVAEVAVPANAYFWAFVSE